jgi:hypothetical protein
VSRRKSVKVGDNEIYKTDDSGSLIDIDQHQRGANAERAPSKLTEFKKFLPQDQWVWGVNFLGRGIIADGRSR